jgi:hypothetical protein
VKKACSKEPEGCSRCKYEEIECHYSEQKHMGRPRKRRGIEMKRRHTAVAPLDVEVLEYQGENFPVDPFFEQAGPLFEIGELALASNYGRRGGASATGQNDPALRHFGASDFNMSMDFGAVNSGLPQPGVPEEHISPKKKNFVEAGPTQLPVTPVPCSCLAAMYLAMSPLQQLSTEVGAALVAVRAATNTARTILRCEQCSRSSTGPVRQPFDAFQNTMLLGTLLPIIVNSYKRLLEIVDHEVIMAQTAGYKMSLGINQDDGFWDQVRLRAENESLENTLMEPDNWRIAVHRILRTDIYGHEMMPSGLKGIIAEMERRQQRAHTDMDSLKNSGSFNGLQQRQCLGERNAPCLQILSVTKIAMESLAIA